MLQLRKAELNKPNVDWFRGLLFQEKILVINRNNLDKKSPLLQDHTEYNATGMDVCNSMQLSEVVKLGPHHCPRRAQCLFSNYNAQHQTP